MLVSYIYFYDWKMKKKRKLPTLKIQLFILFKKQLCWLFRSCEWHVKKWWKRHKRTKHKNSLKYSHFSLKKRNHSFSLLTIRSSVIFKICWRMQKSIHPLLTFSLIYFFEISYKTDRCLAQSSLTWECVPLQSMLHTHVCTPTHTLSFKCTHAFTHTHIKHTYICGCVCVQRRWFHQQEVKLIWRKQSCPPSLTSFENKNGSCRTKIFLKWYHSQINQD